MRARQARARKRRWLVATTSVSVVCAGALVALFGLNQSPPTPGAAASISGDAGEPPQTERPIIVLRDGAVLLDGVEVARTDGIDERGRLEKVDGLYTALKGRRSARPSEERSVLLVVSRDTPALVVKSVFQTAAFAGYADVQFLVQPSDAAAP